MILARQGKNVFVTFPLPCNTAVSAIFCTVASSPGGLSAFLGGRSVLTCSMSNKPPKWQRKSKIHPENTVYIYMRSGWMTSRVSSNLIYSMVK